MYRITHHHSFTMNNTILLVLIGSLLLFTLPVLAKKTDDRNDAIHPPQVADLLAWKNGMVIPDHRLTEFDAIVLKYNTNEEKSGVTTSMRQAQSFSCPSKCETLISFPSSCPDICNTKPCFKWVRKLRRRRRCPPRRGGGGRRRRNSRRRSSRIATFTPLDLNKTNHLNPTSDLDFDTGRRTPMTNITRSVRVLPIIGRCVWIVVKVLVKRVGRECVPTPTPTQSAVSRILVVSEDSLRERDDRNRFGEFSGWEHIMTVLWAV